MPVLELPAGASLFFLFFNVIGTLPILVGVIGASSSLFQPIISADAAHPHHQRTMAVKNPSQRMRGGSGWVVALRKGMTTLGTLPSSTGTYSLRGSGGA